MRLDEPVRANLTRLSADRVDARATARRCAGISAPFRDLADIHVDDQLMAKSLTVAVPPPDSPKPLRVSTLFRLCKVASSSVMVLLT